jgi:hypothetical protein
LGKIIKASSFTGVGDDERDGDELEDLSKGIISFIL